MRGKAVSTFFALALVQSGRTFTDDERALLQYFAGLLDVVNNEQITPYLRLPFTFLESQLNAGTCQTDCDINEVLCSFRDIFAELKVKEVIDNVTLQISYFSTVIKDDNKKIFILRINQDLLDADDPSISTLDEEYRPLF